MNLKQSFIVAIALALIALVAWEVYLRSTMRSHTRIADDKALWSVQRHKVNKLGEGDVVLTGSSRVLFDVQLDIWEEKTGNRPVQLACAGSSPLPVVHDIVNNTDFSGTLVVGVTPGLFFSTTFPMAQPWEWPQTRVDHYATRTFADRSNHWLSIPLQKNFYFISAEEDDLSDNGGPDHSDLDLLANAKVAHSSPMDWSLFRGFKFIVIGAIQVSAESPAEEDLSIYITLVKNFFRLLIGNDRLKQRSVKRKWFIFFKELIVLNFSIKRGDKRV